MGRATSSCVDEMPSLLRTVAEGVAGAMWRKRGRCRDREDHERNAREDGIPELEHDIVPVNSRDRDSPGRRSRHAARRG